MFSFNHCQIDKSQFVPSGGQAQKKRGGKKNCEKVGANEKMKSRYGVERDKRGSEK